MTDWYYRLTLAQLSGRRVRSRIPLENGWAQMPAGTIFEIVGKHNGLELLSAPCPHCSIRVRISGVFAGYVDLLEAHEH